MYKRVNKKLVGICLGNLFEHYDTALFSFLSPFLAPLIFPQQEAVWALIYTYMFFPLGMLAKPLGSIIFGIIGDTYGRERALAISLGGMGVVSLAIAFTPTYLQAGMFVPVAFAGGRILQNMFAAGETIGGGICLLENVEEKNHDIYSSLYAASSISGHLLAAFGVYLTGKYFGLDAGWRSLYLYGFVCAFFALFFRKNVVFGEKKIAKVAFFQSIRRNAKTICVIAVTSGFSYATYSLALVLMNGFVPLVSSISRSEVMRINTYLLVLDVCLLPFFGWVASKFKREKYLLWTCFGSLLCCFPILGLLEGASLIVMVAVRTVFVIFGVAFFAPFHAWVQCLAEEKERYLIVSLGYCLGAQCIGSPTASISLWCYEKTGAVSSIGWYWLGVGVICVTAILGVMYQKKPRVIYE